MYKFEPKVKFLPFLPFPLPTPNKKTPGFSPGSLIPFSWFPSPFLLPKNLLKHPNHPTSQVHQHHHDQHQNNHRQKPYVSKYLQYDLSCEVNIVFAACFYYIKNHKPLVPFFIKGKKHFVVEKTHHQNHTRQNRPHDNYK